MSEYTTHAHTLAVALVIAGFGILGSVAGFRVAFAVVVEQLECAATIRPPGPTACQRVLMELNWLTKVALAGGVVTMLTGGAGRYLLERDGA